MAGTLADFTYSSNNRAAEDIAESSTCQCERSCILGGKGEFP